MHNLDYYTHICDNLSIVALLLKVYKENFLRHYFYAFENGYQQYLTPNEAVDYALKNDTAITCNGLEKWINSPRIRVDDTFKPGWNPALGEYVSSKTEYREKIKEKGLVEVGNDLKSTDFRAKESRIGLNDEDIKYLHDVGADLQGNEIKALKEGVNLAVT